MNEPHYGHAGTVYGGYMYISGKCLWKNTGILLAIRPSQTVFICSDHTGEVL